MVAPKRSGYSAAVRIELYAGEEIIRVAQIGGGRMIFDEAVHLPGTSGEVIVFVDEHECRWQVTWQASQHPRRVVEVRMAETGYTPADATTTGRTGQTRG